LVTVVTDTKEIFDQAHAVAVLRWNGMNLKETECIRVRENAQARFALTAGLSLICVLKEIDLQALL
jgi:hypothetical protein